MLNKTSFTYKTSGRNSSKVVSVLAVMLAVGSVAVDRLCGEQQACRWLPIAGFEDPSMASHTGVYVNSVYRYKVSIPAGLIGHSSPPPAPNHGFGILLGQRGDGYIWVDGSWNSLEYESSEKAAHEGMEFLEDRGTAISRSKMNPWKLGGFQATRLTVWYRCPDSPDVFVTEQLFALNQDKSMIWVVGLDTKQSRYEKDFRVFESILKSWEYNPLPPK